MTQTRLALVTMGFGLVVVGGVGLVVSVTLDMLHGRWC